MSEPYSMDLRERVVGAVEDEGFSRRQTAARYGISISTTINWLRRYRKTGSVAPGQSGGHRPKKIVGGHRNWLVARCSGGDFNLAAFIASWPSAA